MRHATAKAFGDSEELQELIMMCLAFPVGLIGALLFGGMRLQTAENDPGQIVLGWAVPFALGYLQWFVLVPLIIRLARRNTPQSPTGK